MTFCHLRSHGPTELAKRPIQAWQQRIPSLVDLMFGLDLAPLSPRIPAPTPPRRDNAAQPVAVRKFNAPLHRMLRSRYFPNDRRHRPPEKPCSDLFSKTGRRSFHDGSLSRETEFSANARCRTRRSCYMLIFGFSAARNIRAFGESTGRQDAAFSKWLPPLERGILEDQTPRDLRHQVR